MSISAQPLLNLGRDSVSWFVDQQLLQLATSAVERNKRFHKVDSVLTSSIFTSYDQSHVDSRYECSCGEACADAPTGVEHRARYRR